MDRKTALSAAGALTLTAVAAVSALFITMGAGVDSADEPTTPVVAEPEVVTEYEVVQVDPSRLSGMGREPKGSLHALMLDTKGTFDRLIGRYEFGDPSSPLHVSVTVSDTRFYGAIAFGGAVGASEAYIQGHWSCEDLTKTVQLLLKNRDVLDGMDHGLAIRLNDRQKIACRIQSKVGVEFPFIFGAITP